MSKSVKIILIISVLLIATILGGYVYLDNYVSKDTFYEGIIIEGISMGGLTYDEALKALRESKEEIYTKEISINVQDHPDLNYTFDMSDLNLEYNFESVATEAYEIGRSGNILDRYRAIKGLSDKPVEYSLKESIDTEHIDGLIEEIAAEVETEPVNAEFSFASGQFEIIKPVDGKIIDRDKFEESKKKLEQEPFSTGSMEVQLLTLEPEIAEDYYERINGVIGEFSTSFAGSSAGRSHNIRLSAEAFKGKLVMPGEQVSYNKTTGPRQAQFGYQEAPVIDNGVLVPGMGGGVCQTSTTLYNALLLADVKILERSPHSIAPAYVPKGTDAAVATGYLDLVFQNDFDYPIMIDSKVEGSKVFFYIYGDKENRDYSVRISTGNLSTIPYKVIENVDESLSPGARELVQSGRNGYKVNAFKSIVKDGVVLSTERINSDYYREREFIYKVGPEKIVQPEAPVTTPEPAPPTTQPAPTPPAVTPAEPEPVPPEEEQDSEEPVEQIVPAA